MKIEKMRNKLEKVHLKLQKRTRESRLTVDSMSMEEFMSEKGEDLSERSQKLSAAAGYLAVAIECLFAAEQIDG